MHFKIFLCASIFGNSTMSSDNSDDDNDNNDDNHGVPTLSRDRLEGKGSFGDNDNYTDHH